MRCQGLLNGVAMVLSVSKATQYRLRIPAPSESNIVDCAVKGYSMEVAIFDFHVPGVPSIFDLHCAEMRCQELLQGGAVAAIYAVSHRAESIRALYCLI